MTKYEVVLENEIGEKAKFINIVDFSYNYNNNKIILSDSMGATYDFVGCEIISIIKQK